MKFDQQLENLYYLPLYLKVYVFLGLLRSVDKNWYQFDDKFPSH